MRWTTSVGWLAGLLLISGCFHGYKSAGSAGRYSTSSRPHASYFCYDCHGYRYFDPYYDWCAGHGFRYRWTDHPQTVALYRERYVRIREAHPEYGRYRYQPGYRSSARYREPRDYESWRREDSQGRSMERSSHERHRPESSSSKERGEPTRQQRSDGDDTSPNRRGGS